MNSKEKIILTSFVSLVGLVFFTLQSGTPTSLAQSDDLTSLESEKANICGNSPVCSQNSIKSRILLAEINRKISILARKNLPLYVLRKYKNPSKEVVNRLTVAYQNLQESDPKSEISPKYLLSLGEKIAKESGNLENDEKFLAYAHIILKLKETGKDMSALQAESDNAIKIALIDIDKAPARISFSADEIPKLEKAFEQIGKNPWNIGHLQMMKSEILRESIGKNTRFFRAYALAKMRNTVGSRFLSVGDIKHSKQKYPLSCEINSLTDLVNYYRAHSGKEKITEDILLLALPIDTKPLSIVKSGGKSTRIWGDPNIKFVGSISGIQSANPNKMTGYGILADGILPLAKEILKSSGLTLTKGSFDQAEILASLYKGNPVMFWYVAGSANKFSPSQISWQTPEGRNITGYIGEHTGIITGAELDKNGNIVTLEFYE